MKIRGCSCAGPYRKGFGPFVREIRLWPCIHWDAHFLEIKLPESVRDSISGLATMRLANLSQQMLPSNIALDGKQFRKNRNRIVVLVGLEGIAME
mgnify:CR=1 FL=1